MNRHSIYSILFLWLVRPTRENTTPEAYDLFIAAIDDRQSGQTKAALKKYEKAVEIFPGFEAAWLNMANVHEDLGNHPQTLDTFEKALEHLPNSSAIWVSLGSFYGRMGQEDKAEEPFRKAIDCNSENSLAMSSLGFLLVKKGHLEEAEKFLSRSLEVNPERIGESSEGDSYIRKRLDEIRSILRKSSETSSTTSEISSIFRNAQMLMQQGELAKAEVLLKQATTKNPDSVDLWLLLGNLYYQMGNRSEEKEAFRRVLELDEYHLGATTDLADTLNGEGSFQEAEKLLRPIVTKFPTDYKAWMNLGIALLSQDVHEEGEEALKRVIELKPDHVNAHFQLGKQYLLKEDYKQAESALRKTVEYKPDHADGWIELGVALMKNDRQVEAEEAWKTAIKYAPNDDAPWVNLSLIMSVTGRCDESKEALTRAQELAPNDEYVIKAGLQWKSMCGGGVNTDISWETVDAVSDISEYREFMNTGALMFDILDKSDPEGWGMLGTVLRACGRLDEAEEAFNEAFKHPSKSSATILGNYSVLLKQLGREDEAEKFLLRLTKEHSDYAVGWLNLGNLYLNRCDWKRAEQMYQKALGNNPDPNLMVKIKWNRGIALKEMMDYERAEISLLEALEIDPKNANIKTILEKVRALRLDKFKL
ncbi:MAG: tetratricopeptide repeat protein [Candidatus Thorarchaeota archaeon]